MKKILALLLALCLALSALPAVAENDFSGTWYLLMLGMTGGTFELNADGTFTGTAVSGEETQATEGTWSADGDLVTLVISSAPMAMTYDGTDLILSGEAMSAMGMDSMAGMDMSMFDGMLKLSREPAAVSVAEYSTYMSDGTVPEGKTKEDMDAVTTQMMLLISSLSASLDIGDLSVSGSGADSADRPEVDVLEENFYICESYFGQEAVYIAKVQNNNESAVWLDSGNLILKDADGNEVSRREWFGTCGSRYLSPGEISYVSFQADIDEGVTVSGYDREIIASGSTYSEDTAVELGNVELRSEEMFSSINYYTAASFTNRGEEPLSGVEVLFVLKDSEGKMIDLEERGLGMMELAAGSTITVVSDVSSTAVKYCESNGLTLGEVEAVAWR